MPADVLPETLIIGGGIGGEPGVGLSHAGPTVTAGRDRATAKSDTLMKVLFQPSG